MKCTKQKQAGFTIVELLIVVVVIAILAAITTVAYNGVSQQARISALKSEVVSALRALEAAKISSSTGQYPVNLSSYGFGSSSTLTYYYSTATNSFCVQSKEGAQVYSATSEAKMITEGGCGDAGMIGWWKLNGNATDSSTSAYNGIATSTSLATGQNGQTGQALSFSSASNSNISINHNSVLGTDPQTFSVWIRPTSWSSPNASAIISKRASTANGYYISYATGNSSLVFDCGAFLDSNRWVPNYTPPLNTWTHLIFTCNSESGVALYVNGALHGSRASVNRSAMSASTAALKFGMDSSAAQQYWNGSIDDIRIYNRTLNGAEAAALYANGAQ